VLYCVFLCRRLADPIAFCALGSQVLKTSRWQRLCPVFLSPLLRFRGDSPPSRTTSCLGVSSLAFWRIAPESAMLALSAAVPRQECRPQGLVPQVPRPTYKHAANHPPRISSSSRDASQAIGNVSVCCVLSVLSLSACCGSSCGTIAPITSSLVRLPACEAVVVGDGQECQSAEHCWLSTFSQVQGNSGLLSDVALFLWLLLCGSSCGTITPGSLVWLTACEAVRRLESSGDAGWDFAVKKLVAFVGVRL